MKLSMSGQEKGNLLIQVTTWGGLTACLLLCMYHAEKGIAW
jgi:hypothetical protein